MNRRGSDSSDKGGRPAEKRLWKPSVLARYWLVQAPGIALLGLVLYVLDRLFSIPASVIAVVLAIWVAKDAALYPWLWRSYDAHYPSAHSMDGEHGFAAARIDPTGHARVRGELWRAELASGAEPIDAGAPLTVEATRDFTLLVRGTRAASEDV